MKALRAENYSYQFIAGNLALDFVNTVAFRSDPEKMVDHLQSVEEVYRWARQACLTDAVSAGASLSKPALRFLRAIREQLFAIFHAIAVSESIPPDALRQVSDALHGARSKRCLSTQGTLVRWIWNARARYADILLDAILTAATDLLTSGSRGSVRQCADSSCGWLFLDRSNAGRRRWCSMADCGNRNKAREHYRRKASE